MDVMFIIENIDVDVLNKNRLIVSLNNTFDESHFKSGDFVTFQDCVIEKVVPHQLDIDVKELNTFINQPCGHEIIDICGSRTFSILKHTNDSLTSCLNLFNLNEPLKLKGRILNHSFQSIILCSYSQWNC